MVQPLLSIIIPTFNRAHLIRETLDSILLQSYQNWECLIVDDGSTDHTSGVVQEYSNKDSRFQYHQRPVNSIKGPNSCRNYGFELCKGDYVNWFDSDDLYHPFALENYTKAIQDDTDVVIARLEVVDFETKKKIKENTILSNNIIEDYYVGKIAYYVCGPLWKRSFLTQQKQLFDPAIRNLDDWDFNLRMLYAKPKVLYIDKPLIKYRFHTTSLSQELAKLNFNEIQSEFTAREKHLLLLSQNKMANLTVLKKFIKNRYAFFFREALMQNHPKKFYFLKKLLRCEFFLFDIYGMLKTVTGYMIFSLFKKGYALLK